MMRKRVFGATLGGLGLALGLGACVGQDPLVGRNTADEAEQGGTPSMLGGGGSGGQVGGQVTDQSISYMVNQLRTARANEKPLCMPRQLPLQANGLASCRIFRTDMDPVGLYPVASSTCSCDRPDHAPVDPAVRTTVLDYLRSVGSCDFSGLPACEDLCLCELLQTTDARRADCLAEAPLDSSGDGWCYISPDDGLGTAATLDFCPRDRRRVRFFGDETESSLYLFTCGGITAETTSVSIPPAAVGEPCLPTREGRSSFEGFSLMEVTLDLGTAACDSGLCLVNHFEGRVSCPYGQYGDDLERGNPDCFVPGSDAAVTVPVQSQRLARFADDVVTCSCQCDGPGPGPYCDCPDDMVCSRVVDAVGIAAADAHVGSYCVKRGTEFDLELIGTTSSETCADRGPGSCGELRPY